MMAAGTLPAPGSEHGPCADGCEHRDCEATYDPDDNKLRLRSSGRLDDATYGRVNKAGFIWAPKQDLFVAPAWTPEREDLLLELCVEVEDEDTTSLIDRAKERAGRFEGYGDNRRSDARGAQDAANQLSQRFEWGQPILVGHHSEKKARKDKAKIEGALRKAVSMWDTAKYWEQRADGSISHAQHKLSAPVRARRIKTLEAERRSRQRQVEKSTLMSESWGQEPLTLDLAMRIADIDHIYYRDGGSLWSQLRDEKITVDEARQIALESHKRTIARAERWAAHLDRRLSYERQLLNASGWEPPKPKKRPKLPPILNYRHPDGQVRCQNRYRTNEVMVYRQVDMTRNLWKKTSPDWKGTVPSEDGTHRVRTVVSRGAQLCAVFITDSKAHPVPEPKEKAEAAIEIPTLTRKPVEAPPAPSQEERAIEGMRQTLKAGVEVVVADQLYETPPWLAKRMVRLADIRNGHRILEPSAGTGRLLAAVLERNLTHGVIVAVERDAQLSKRLSREVTAAYGGGIAVLCDDFLAVRPTAHEPFDRILMNPPFRQGEDIKHILHALGFLAPGGRLVAVCANGPRQEKALRHRTDTWEALPEDTFKEAGTSVRAALIVIRKR